MKRIRVPDGMLKAAAKDVFYSGEPDALEALELRLEAALIWLSEHPQVPTDEVMDEFLAKKHPSLTEKTVMCRFACEWQRRMFVEEEPEIKLPPLKVGGDYYESILAQPREREGQLLEALTELEAYRRGLRKRGE